MTPPQINEEQVEPHTVEDGVMSIGEGVVSIGEGVVPGINDNNNGLPGEYLDQCAGQGELGDGRLFIQLTKGRLCYDHSARQWFRFVDHIWKEDLIEQTLETLQEVADTYTVRASQWAWTKLKATKDQDKELAKSAIAHENILLKKIALLQQMHHLKNVLAFAVAGVHSLGIAGSEFDSNPDLLGCSNGVLNLNTLEFRDGQPGDFVKSPCPTEWKGLDEEALGWERFLWEVFNKDWDLIHFLQRLCGYMLSGTAVDHVLPVLYGPQGRNGKGTMLETLSAVLGPRLSGPVSSELLLDQRFSPSADQANPGILSLRGKRLVWASETNEGRTMNTGKVKWICGGDTLTGRPLYGKHQLSFKPTHTLLLLTNHKPRIDAEDSAVWERILLIPFDVRFVDNPQADNERPRDKHLPDKLKAEASGILAWIVRGLVQWREQGLNPPEKVAGATKAYRKSEDVLQYFIDEKCHVADYAEVRAGSLYGVYKTWAIDNGHRAMSSTRFGKKIKERFSWEKKAQSNVYFGIGLLDK